MNRTASLLAQGIAGAYFLSSDVNVRYITGFTGGESEVLATAAGTTLFTDSRYAEQAARELSDDIEIVVTDSEGRLPAVKSVFGKTCGPGVVLGIEEQNISAAACRCLLDALGHPETADISQMLLELRAFKTAEEIEYIRKAARATDEVMEYLAGVIHEGMSEYEIRAELLCATARKNMEPSFPPIVAAGANGAMPHASVSSYRVKNGDLLTLDFGCRCSGYCADMTRTVGIGRVDGELKTIYDVVEKAQEQAEEAVSIGISARRIDEIARSRITEAGYGEYFGHGTGHGVGLQIHELPVLNRTSDAVIERGMVFTIEPGIYVPGLGGVRIEDTYAAGIGSLFRFPKKLIELH